MQGKGAIRWLDLCEALDLPLQYLECLEKVACKIAAGKGLRRRLLVATIQFAEKDAKKRAKKLVEEYGGSPEERKREAERIFEELSGPLTLEKTQRGGFKVPKNPVTSSSAFAEYKEKQQATNGGKGSVGATSDTDDRDDAAVVFENDDSLELP